MKIEYDAETQRLRQRVADLEAELRYAVVGKKGVELQNESYRQLIKQQAQEIEAYRRTVLFLQKPGFLEALNEPLDPNAKSYTVQELIDERGRKKP